MANEEFTLIEARAKCGQIVRSRASVAWPEGVIGKVVEVGFSQFPDCHPRDRMVFTIAWQRFPEYGAVPHSTMPLSKRQYQDSFQELWVTDEDQYKALFGC